MTLSDWASIVVDWGAVDAWAGIAVGALLSTWVIVKAIRLFKG